MTLKNTKVEFILDENNRIYNEYEKEENLGIFSYNVHKVNENKDVNYNKLIYDKNGFNQSGFDKSGFDQSGLSEKLNSYNVYESKSSKKVLSIENGRRVLKFDQPLNIYQNSKSIYPFYSSENIKYKKENRIFISSFSKKEDVYIPESTLIIENEKGLYFSKGVARIFSGSKQNNPNVINELNINSSKKDYKRDIIINIGENAGLKSKIKDTIKEELASIEIKSSFYPFFKEKEDFKVTLTKKSISFFNYTNEKNIKIVNSRLIHKKDIENVKKIINNFDSKEYKEELNKLSHKLNELTVEDILLDINNKKEINEDFYFLEYYTKTN